MQLLEEAGSKNINAYLLRYITTYAELNRLKSLNVCYVMLGQPLFSSIDKVRRFEIPVRWTPNVVDNSNFGLNSLAHGTWIRPEDLKFYDEIPDSIAEFPGARDYKAEQAFFRVYKKGEWQQDLGSLLLEFKGMNINNYLLSTDESFGKTRMNCHQMCEETPGGVLCHYCDTCFRLANPEFIKKIKE